MYAYCNNHPVGTADYDGHVLSIVLSILYIAVAIVLSVVWVCFVAPVLMDHQNSGYATPYMERDLIETVPSTPSVGNILNKSEVKAKFKDDAEETTETGVEDEGGTNPPSECNISSKQFGKKWGKHKKDYPDLSMDEYKNLIDDVFKSPDKIIQDVENNEFLYLKGNDLLRVTNNGEFVSLYPGAESGKVLSAIEKGGTIWPK